MGDHGAYRRVGDWTHMTHLEKWSLLFKLTIGIHMLEIQGMEVLAAALTSGPSASSPVGKIF